MGKISTSFIWWKVKYSVLIWESNQCIFCFSSDLTVAEIILVWNSNRLITVSVHPKSPGISRAEYKKFHGHYFLFQSPGHFFLFAVVLCFFWSFELQIWSDVTTFEPRGQTYYVVYTLTISSELQVLFGIYTTSSRINITTIVQR